MQHIVVGVDGSAASRRALHWAVDHARMSGADLQVIHAWTVPDLGADPLAGMIAAPAELEAQARRELDLVLAGVDERALPGRIEPTLVRDPPRRRSSMPPRGWTCWWSARAGSGWATQRWGPPATA